MTKECKLAPSVPTDTQKVQSAMLVAKGVSTFEEYYTAMLKDAPTLVEVDLAMDSAEYLLDYDCEMDFIDFLIKKHGKLYAKSDK